MLPSPVFRRIAALVIAVGWLAGRHLVAAEFAGWQAMRVMPQEGNPERLLLADLDGSGRRQVVVVNNRQSRLDVYRWLPAGRRPTPTKADPARPNELPLAPEWEHYELGLDELPADAVAYDLDRDGRPELLVLTGPQLKILAYKQQPATGEQTRPVWKKTGQWDLLPGTPLGRGRYLLVRALPGNKAELLVSCEAGIQALPLEAGSRAAWLSPREKVARTDWALVDVDGDGDDDLIEATSIARQSVRWYEAFDGRLLPAQVLHEQAAQGFGLLPLARQPAEVLLLGGSQDGHLRRYVLAAGDESELGRRDALPMPGGAKTAWTGIKLGDRAALVAVDPAQPRLRVHELGPRGWLGEQTYPTLGGVRALAAPAAAADTLLVWIKDAATLHVSRWEHGRLTYPQPFQPNLDSPPTKATENKVADGKTSEKDRATAELTRVLALETVGSTTWWAVRVGSVVDLYVWPADQKSPQRTRFEGLGAKVDRVVWLGGKRLLVQDAFATTAKLASVVDSPDAPPKTVVTEPTSLGKLDLNEFALYATSEATTAPPRVGRLVEGVLQWLADDLHPVDQVMLPDGQKLAALLLVNERTAWALEQGGAFIHRLEADAGGVLRVVRSIRPPVGSQLRRDAVLGLVMLDTERVVRLSPGRPQELKLIESIDSRVGRPSGVKEATIHRLFTADVDGDGLAEAVLSDDRRHQLTVLRRRDAQLQSLLSWQVFEDQTYPYGGGQQDSLVTEPRALLAGDVDGDGQQDLVLLSQDRVLVYLARELK